ncbi:MAG: hypothetical protein H6929_07805 [Rhodoferax sp.]|nr:hypothetical protein [Rhodoferax sp.]
MHCSSCKAPVLRRDCHQNRYGELICRSCQAMGVRFTWRRRLRHQLRRSVLSVWLVLAATGLALLAVWLFEFMRLLQPAKLLIG